MDIKYSYLGYSLIFVFIWILFYVLRPDLRRRMFVFSIVITPLGPLSEIWFLKDYWRRDTILGYPIGIEDAIFSFAIAGIAYGIYKIFFNRKAEKSSDRPAQAWLVFAFFVITILPLLVLTNLLGVNSIFSSALSFFLIAAVIWAFRSDLLQPSIVSGVLVLAL